MTSWVSRQDALLLDPGESSHRLQSRFWRWSTIATWAAVNYLLLCTCSFRDESSVLQAIEHPGVWTCRQCWTYQSHRIWPHHFALYGAIRNHKNASGHTKAYEDVADCKWELHFVFAPRLIVKETYPYTRDEDSPHSIPTRHGSMRSDFV